MTITKNFLLNWYSSMKKNQKDSNNLWHRKFSLNVRFRHFSTTHANICESQIKKLFLFYCFFAKIYSLLTHVRKNPPLRSCTSNLYEPFMIISWRNKFAYWNKKGAFWNDLAQMCLLQSRQLSGILQTDCMFTAWY